MSGSARLVARPAETQCNEYGAKVFEHLSRIFRRSAWFFGLTILLLWKTRCTHHFAWSARRFLTVLETSGSSRLQRVSKPGTKAFRAPLRRSELRWPSRAKLSTRESFVRTRVALKWQLQQIHSRLVAQCRVNPGGLSSIYFVFPLTPSSGRPSQKDRSME